MPSQLYLTTAELAERWRINPQSIRNLRSLGQMPIKGVKLGKAVRYRMADVEAYEAAAEAIATQGTKR